MLATLQPRVMGIALKGSTAGRPYSLFSEATRLRLVRLNVRRINLEHASGNYLA